MQIRSLVSAIHEYNSKSSIYTNGEAYLANTEHVVYESINTRLHIVILLTSQFLFDTFINTSQLIIHAVCLLISFIGGRIVPKLVLKYKTKSTEHAM
jgi:hypothetical protein